MYKSFVILIIPISFSFLFDFIFISFENINNNLLRNNSQNIKVINIHKNFKINYNLENLDTLDNLDNKDYLTINRYKKINPHKVYKNFILDVSSSTINKIYSEKLIEKDDISEVVSIFSISSNTETINFLNTKKDNKSLNKIQLISSDWEKNFSDKKIKFIETLLPLINYENKKIVFERKKLLNIKDFLYLKKTLSSQDIKYLINTAKKYKIPSKNKHKIDLIYELLINVDIIPNSIVLAQAINESGWGTSRFAKEYNALFGQYTYDENNGVIPSEREKGKKHLIKNFSSINKSVESYFKNINTHYAYDEFRKIRSQINKQDLDKNVKLLTGTLNVYAEDKSYVDIINSIIDSNNLGQFDIIIQNFINS